MVIMKIKVHKEAGYEEALMGLSFNKNQPLENMHGVADKLVNKDGGHNKFLEAIIIWVEVEAPRYMWSQMDTYRLSTKQSQSTMHTILKRPLTKDDFKDRHISWWTLRRLNKLIRNQDFHKLKKELPEGFMQRRMWCMSYKTLRNIYKQRKNHRLREWHMFLNAVLDQIQHPDFIVR